jgi:hypothetical protein
MSTPKGTTRRTAAQNALIDMRKELTLSQQDLAVALRTTVRSVARWETAAFPHGRIVKRLQQFAAKRGLPDHAQLFQRLIQQEEFLEANRKFFWTQEGLDLQVAITQVRHFCRDPEVADCWSKAVESLRAAVSRLLDLPKKDAYVWETDELFDLWERLGEYAKQPQKEAMGLKSGVATHKHDQKQEATVKRKRSK